MAQNSKIEWTDHTANLWWGCTKVHTGCNNCYAEALSNRFGNNIWGNDAPRKEIRSVWADLDKYNKQAKLAGVKQRVFVGSMMDIFERPMRLVNSKGNEVSYNTDSVRQMLFGRIEDGRYSHLIFLLLTKRPSNINKYIPERWKVNPPANVMFGTSISDQETADRLIPQLLEVKGKKFLSVEPQLGPIDLMFDVCRTGNLLEDKINWVIQGGESGHNKRPFNLEWAYSMKEQCAQAGVPYFFKQIDKVKQIPEDLMIREFPVFNHPVLHPYNQ